LPPVPGLNGNKLPLIPGLDGNIYYFLHLGVATNKY